MENASEMKKAIIDYVKDEYAAEDQEIDENTRLISDGIVDSFSLVSLKRFLERRYNVLIPDEKATSEVFDSINEICLLVQSCAR